MVDASGRLWGYEGVKSCAYKNEVFDAADKSSMCSSMSPTKVNQQLHSYRTNNITYICLQVYNTAIYYDGYVRTSGSDDSATAAAAASASSDSSAAAVATATAAANVVALSWDTVPVCKAPLTDFNYDVDQVGRKW